MDEQAIRAELAEVIKGAIAETVIKQIIQSDEFLQGWHREVKEDAMDFRIGQVVSFAVDIADVELTVVGRIDLIYKDRNDIRLILSGNSSGIDILNAKDDHLYVFKPGWNLGTGQKGWVLAGELDTGEFKTIPVTIKRLPQ